MYLNSIQLDIDRDKAFPGGVMGGGGVIRRFGLLTFPNYI